VDFYFYWLSVKRCRNADVSTKHDLQLNCVCVRVVVVVVAVAVAVVAAVVYLTLHHNNNNKLQPCSAGFVIFPFLGI
jgi:hypothetical protein